MNLLYCHTIAGRLGFATTPFRPGGDDLNLHPMAAVVAVGRRSLDVLLSSACWACLQYGGLRSS